MAMKVNWFFAGLESVGEDFDVFWDFGGIGGLRGG